MDYSILDFLSLLGAVGLFLYGMKVMSEGLQKAAGNRLRSILDVMTKNRFMGVITGIAITALIQSSSASTVMVVSFVNAGLMSLEQSMAVIFGANVGTTFTAWIVSIFGFKVNLSVVLLPLLAIAVPLLFLKKNQYKNIGEFLIGFVLLFYGLDFIQQNVPVLDANAFGVLQGYANMGFWSVLIFLTVGLVVTLVIQSSAATFAIVLVMATKGWIPFDMACAMVLGSNIGTTITPLLASLGANLAAKKAAVGHLLFNVLGTLWTLVAWYAFIPLIEWICIDVFSTPDPTLLYTKMSQGVKVSPHEMAALAFSISFGMSMFHTVFNLINLSVMIWFTKGYVKMVNHLVHSHHKKEDDEFQLKYISAGLLNAAELNITQAQREIVVYAERVERMLGMVKSLVHIKTGTSEFNKVYSRIGKYEDISDRMEIEIGKYLNNLVDGRLSYDAKLRVSTMLSIVSEIESIADSCNNIARTLVRKEEAGAHFVDYNYENIDQMLKLVGEAMSNMIAVLCDIDNATSDDLIRNYNKEREINNMRNMLRTENIENINQKKYPYQAGIFYMDIICEAEKLGDFIVNVIDGIETQIRRRERENSDEIVHNGEVVQTGIKS